jgi:hypothetical protein
MVMTERLRDTGFFDGPIVHRAKQAWALNSDEKRVVVEKLTQRRGVPMSMDMVWMIRRQYWQGAAW